MRYGYQLTFFVLQQTLEAADEEDLVFVQRLVEVHDAVQPRAEAVELAKDGILAARQRRLAVGAHRGALLLLDAALVLGQILFHGGVRCPIHLQIVMISFLIVRSLPYGKIFFSKS